MGRIVVAVSGRVGDFVMLCHRYPQSVFGSRVELPQTRWESNAGRSFPHNLSGHSAGQLSLIHRVRLSSLTSPAARERMMAAASASGTTKSTPLTPRKVYSASSEVRLLPSTNG